MKANIKINGQALSVEVSVEVYECMDEARRKSENLYHEKRRHWDTREFDEYIAATEGRLPYRETLCAVRFQLCRDCPSLRLHK